MDYSTKQEAEGKLRNALHGNGVGSEEHPDPTHGTAPAVSHGRHHGQPQPSTLVATQHGMPALGHQHTALPSHIPEPRLPHCPLPLWPYPHPAPGAHLVSFPLTSTQTQNTVTTTAQAAAFSHMAEPNTVAVHLRPLPTLWLIICPQWYHSLPAASG